MTEQAKHTAGPFLKIRINIPRDLYQPLYDYARAHGTSMSAVCRGLLAERLAEAAAARTAKDS